MKFEAFPQKPISTQPNTPKNPRVSIEECRDLVNKNWNQVWQKYGIQVFAMPDQNGYLSSVQGLGCNAGFSPGHPFWEIHDLLFLQSLRQTKREDSAASMFAISLFLYRMIMVLQQCQALPTQTICFATNAKMMDFLARHLQLSPGVHFTRNSEADCQARFEFRHICKPEVLMNLLTKAQNSYALYVFLLAKNQKSELSANLLNRTNAALDDWIERVDLHSD